MKIKNAYNGFRFIRLNCYALLAVVILWLMPVNKIYSQRAADEWKELLQKEGLAKYFEGLFNHLGIKIKETGEAFTVHHLGTHFSITDGINIKEADYIAEISLKNVENMKQHGGDAAISAYESYKIMSVLFTPLTQSALSHPMFRKALLMKMAGIENHIHVVLVSPDKQEETTHTLLFINKEWLVIPGLHGAAKRKFMMNQEDALEFQRKAFKAKITNTKKEWRAFRKWYLQWRKTVSE